MLPREKLQQFGVQTLTNAELFSILLGSGSSKENIFDLSARITSAPDFRKSLLEQQIEYWTKVPGIGRIKAARLVASLELSKRMLIQKFSDIVIRHAKDVFEHFRHQLLGKTNESFYILCLDTKNRIVLSKEVHIGFSNQVVTDMKCIFSTILQTGCFSFICVHNHPSGDPKPSPEDRELTRKIYAAAIILDLKFLDHVIITLDSCYSFCEEEPELFQ